MKKQDNRTEKLSNLLDGAIGRAGFDGKRKEMYSQAAIGKRTFENHKKKGDYLLSELTRLDAVLHFTDEECISLIRGV